MESKLEKLLSPELRNFYRFLRNHARIFVEKENVSNTFTSHGLDHSDRIVRNIELMIHRRVQVHSYEAFVLLGASVLHDIALACPDQVLPKEQLKHGWYEAELRRNHGMYSAKYVRSQLFAKIVLAPLITHLKMVILKANKVFNHHQIQGFTLYFKASYEQVALSKEVERIEEMLSIRRKMEKQKRFWNDYINSRTYKDGVLKKQLVGNEFHIYRRWGSSTHRYFVSQSGLEKGGGYYLSWNSCGLCYV